MTYDGLLKIGKLKILKNKLDKILKKDREKDNFDFLNWNDEREEKSLHC